MIQFSQDGRASFVKLLTELAQTYKLWTYDRNTYYQEINRDKLIFTTINPPSDLHEEMSKKHKNKEHCIYQLYHSSKSLLLVKEVSVAVRKCCNLNCLPEELHSVIEAIVYEYINANLEDFVDSIEQVSTDYKFQLDSFMKIMSTRVFAFKKGFMSSVFQFPVTIFNLEEELKLSDSIRLIPVESMDLPENELAIFNKGRVFNCNFYLEIYVKARCSKELAFQQSEKARDATYNILKLLATYLSPNAIPLLTSNDRIAHPFSFYRYGGNRESISNATTYRFPFFQFDSKQFWMEFHRSQNEVDSIMHTALEVIELLLLPNFGNERVVERLERSLLWYGDAVTESVYYLQVQKLVSSMEALVNFNDGDVTDAFKRRITNLNISYAGPNVEIEEKARRLYDVRSKIVHGTSIDEKLNFNIVSFCSKNLLRAIYFFSYFGFEKKNFNKTLARFLDELPMKIKITDD